MRFTLSWVIVSLMLGACGKQATYSASPVQPGPKGETGAAGRDGVNGQNGTNGQNGVDGRDGINGQDGISAPVNPYAIVAVIDPCGDEGSYDEVILKLANGTILAHYSDGNKQFFTLVGPGNYNTTDGHACHFTINNDGSVIW